MAGFKSFTPLTLPAPGSTFTLEDPEAHHLARVLRAQINDPVTLFNGSGAYCLSTIASFQKKSLSLNILSSHSQPPPPYKISLAICLPKSDTFESILKHAVELGVHHIYPISSQRSEVHIPHDRLPSKLSRWSSITIEACKQSGNLFLPTISPPLSLPNFLQNLPTDATPYIASLQPQAQPFSLHKSISTTPHILWLIGPEGDLSPSEYASLPNSFIHTSLAPNILRVETASLTALAITQSRLHTLFQ